MNPILLDYFGRLKQLACNDGLSYHVYERDAFSSMPFSVHFRFKDKNKIQRNSWGSGKDLDEALGKALMEMVERIYFSGFSPFSYKKVNGFLRVKFL